MLDLYPGIRSKGAPVDWLFPCQEDSMATDPEDRGGEIEPPTSPFGDDSWYGDADLTPGDIDDINAVAFATLSGETLKPDCPSSDSAPTVSRRRKKPKGFPKRPLSGYNLFFKEERVKILVEFSKDFDTVHDEEIRAIRADADRSKVSFQDLGKIIGKRWKALSDKDRRKYDNLAEHDSCRYRNEMDEYNEAKRRRNDEKNRKSFPETKDSNLSSSAGWSTLVISRPPAFDSLSRLPVPARLPTDAQDWHPAGPEANDKTIAFPIPPGTELSLADHCGVERLYQVQYKFFKMTLKDAQTYMEQLSRTSSVTPYGFLEYPAPPSTARFVPDPCSISILVLS